MKASENATTAAEIVDAAGADELEPQSKFDEFSDAGLADRAIDDGIKNRLRKVVGMGWIGWTGKGWTSITTDQAVDAIRVWAEEYLEALDQAVVDASGKEQKFAAREKATTMSHKVGARSVLKAVLGLVAGRLTTQPEELDADPELTACGDDVVDLATKERLCHDPDMLMTKSTGTNYVPGATSPTWDKAREAFADEETERYVQRVIGQAATGYPAEIVHVSMGSGSNGKSTVIDAVMAALGDYAVRLPPSVLAGNARDRHPAELMPLQGCRLGVAEELPEGRHLDVAQMKRLTDTAEVTARNMGENFVTFPAQHSLMVATNYRLIVSEADYGTQRRLREIPWPKTFVNDPKGPNELKSAGSGMKRKLRQQREREAVLAWIIEGAHEVLADGGEIGDPPKAVRDATEAWLAQSNPLGTGLGEMTVEDEDGFIPTADVVKAAKRIYSRAGMRKPNDMTIKDRIRAQAGWERLDQDRITVGSGKWSVSVLASAPEPGKKIRGIKGRRFATSEEVDEMDSDDDF
nr:phage/plasmid primase, P4 family [Brevibacterium epidermidis]